MSGRAMNLKARIRDVARKKDMSAQVVLQNYMFERFLERLSKSEYRRKFILKGGILIAAIVGIENRATMDLDATIKSFPINAETIAKAITDICNIPVTDAVAFHFTGVEAIRDDDVYGGYRVSIIAGYETIKVPMQIDVTTGDSITPKEVRYLFKKILENGDISVWAYNIETILAEKVETILRRGELNTRLRDFYDVYILIKTQDYCHPLFVEALRSTALHRGTARIFINIGNRLEEIKKSGILRSRWVKYTQDYSMPKESHMRM